MNLLDMLDDIEQLDPVLDMIDERVKALLNEGFDAWVTVDEDLKPHLHICGLGGTA
jgi:hypothetical protein